MIILDTPVVSEPLKPSPDAKVIAWLDRQQSEILFVTVTNIAELKMGVAILPDGKRKSVLLNGLGQILATYFGPRILEATERVADLHAEIFARARSRGVAIGFADAQISAIAMAHGFAVATRDVPLFEAAGVDVINPWS